ncbi:MAG: outer membrane protein assembly factor BamB family protein, partial [Candidatus Latescibacterota bacterium]
MFRQNLQHTGRSGFVAPSAAGAPKWTYQTGSSVYSSPAIASDGTIYVGSGDKNLYAIHPNGSLKWKYLAGSFVHSSPAISSDGTIYVGSHDKYLYALNPDGSLKWKFLADYGVLSSPAIAADGTVYVGAIHLYAINPNGSLKWKFPTGSSISSSPSVASDGTVYIGSNDNYLYAINPDGSQKWRILLDGNEGVKSSPAIAPDGTVYVGSTGRYLCAINPDGSIKWKYMTLNPVDSSPAIAGDGTIYFGSGHKSLDAVNPDGSLKWKYLTNTPVNSSPSIASEGTVYMGSEDNNIYAINPDGSLKWQYQTASSSGTEINFSPAISSDGTVYIGSYVTNALYAFGPIAVISPNGGENWTANASQSITWNSAANIATVKLEYSLDNGQSWILISDTVNAASGSYNWTAPNTLSNNAMVKVSDAVSGAFDISNSAFTIAASPSVTLASPQGGESWISNTQHAITWTADIIPTVTLEYSADGQSWTIIAADVNASGGSYSWTLPVLATTGAFVRISNSAYGVSDSSSAFSILPPPSVSLSSPDGGETLVAGTVHDITWASSTLSNVKIEYSTNGDSAWSVIAASTNAAAGRHAWTVPDTPSAQCRMRISDAENPSVSDQSNGAFAIIPVTVTLISPNGGESWTVGSSHTISWTSSAVARVKLEYSADNGVSWTTIIESTDAAAGSYPWTALNFPGAFYLVRISDASNPSVRDECNGIFTILPSVRVVSPNGGESWPAGSTQDITWDVNGVENVKLQYSANGSPWTTITASTGAAAGRFPWPVPAAVGMHYRVRVSDAADSAAYDDSDAEFGITARVMVTAPNGGEQWNAGTTQTIMWSSTSVTAVRIEYTLDGINWRIITSSAAASSGAYSWAVPADITTTSGKIRITDAGNDSVSDASNNSFSIRTPPSLSVTSPNGGEAWIAGETRSISWIFTTVNNVKIEYSASNGASWMPVVESIDAAQGSFAWTIPSVNSSQCMIRVSDASNPAISDQSNGVFTIIPLTVTLA